ncbi:MAG: hypothetical protein EBQ96_03040 [Proteobacteria bacterium]|nr:hypothetical protein [Pseudomonadota bacterium]
MYQHITESAPGESQTPASAPYFNHACHPHTTTLVMGAKDLDAFMGLHELVTANTSFVLPRSRKSIETHIANGHYAIAIYSDAPEYRGQMIAQALIALPDMEGASNLDGYPITDKKKTAIVQCFGVHPDHKKCGIEALFVAIEAIAIAENRTHILAKMNADNMPSIKMFGNTANEKARYKQVGEAVRIPGQTYKSVFMQKVIAQDAGLATIQQPRNSGALVYS